MTKWIALPAAFVAAAALTLNVEAAQKSTKRQDANSPKTTNDNDAKSPSAKSPKSTTSHDGEEPRFDRRNLVRRRLPRRRRIPRRRRPRQRIGSRPMPWPKS